MLEQNEGLTVTDLEIQKLGLEDRIRRIELDLKQALDPDLTAQASELSNRIILRRLLEIEQATLAKIKVEISRKRSL